jgi:hypothetical protein
MDLLQARDVETKTFAADRIPEKVTIGRLSDRFLNRQSCPHGKIVNALADKTREQQAGRLFSQ